MSSRMVSRGGKTRFIGFVCMILVLSAVLYVFHETQAELDGVRHSASSCGRQLESVSSQLQVLVEQKLKLERSLEEEKREHIKSKEDLNELIQDEKQLRDKQNTDYMIRITKLERSNEVLQEEENKLKEELQNLKSKYDKEEEVKHQLTKQLNEAKIQIQDFKNEKVVLDSLKENAEKDQNNNLPKLNELSQVQFIKKTNDNTTVTKVKSASVTPAINPQAIDGATAKSSTPMISSKVVSLNESVIENDEANPISQPNMDINSIKLLAGVQNETSPTQESQVSGNESMKAMPAPPQEEGIVKKEQLNNVEEEKLLKQKNNSYKDEYEQEHFKEDEDDEDMNDFDAREDNQHNNNIRYTR